ncbi:glycerate kinase family protein [Armatimonas rosea]|uniref:Glycerate kinase n=1 Tax=Armatimonas rosea TaxID=685828 RepID=A0A7W9ST53_ARMRO|nr:glycerate kinase [Armatimonas rosea]MBB6052376.1 glycerate kinase [Armatimonas rosea]
MKVLVCPDSFKGALSAPEVASAMATGWQRVFPDAELVLLPVADGGEGTLDVLLSATGGQRLTETVTGPLGEPVSAAWGLLPDGTAVVELAQAASLSLVPLERRDPKHTTTYGVGELLLRATRRSQKLLITLGGSATNDGGAGVLEAFGHRQQPGHSVRIACDVDNPLTGPRGASAVFGPQKGATPDDIPLLDARLAALRDRLALPEQPGDGAAGGAAYGLRWLFPGAQLVPGIELVLDAIGFDQHLAGADLVLTGEGRLDSQTLGGKAIAGVARRARAANVPVLALVGSLGNDIRGTQLADAGITAALPLAPGPCTLAESLANTAPWLADAAERAARLTRLYS